MQDGRSRASEDARSGLIPISGWPEGLLHGYPEAMTTHTLQRCLIIMGLLVSLFSSCFAMAQADPSQFSPGKPPEIPEMDPADKLVAEGMLQQAIEAFRKAPAIVCETTVKTESGPNQKELIVEAEFGPGSSMRVETPEALIVCLDGYLNVVLYKVPDRYLKVPLVGSVTDTIESIFGDRFVAGFEIMMRESESITTWLDALTMRSVVNPRVTGLEETTAEDGTVLSRIYVAGKLGAGWIDYNPQTKLIVAVRTEMYPIEGADGFFFHMDLKTNTAFMESLPKPIVLDAGKRTPVGSKADLDPVTRNRLVAGNPAPALQVPQLDGTVVNLADLKGKTVILDFWATWCGPCKQGLPKLDELYVEHGENKGDVLVYAVDVMERMRKPEERIQTVSEFWEKMEYKVPTLISLDDQVPTAWSITSIPKMVVIGPDGKIVSVLNGFYKDMKSRIDNAIEQARAD